MKFLQLPSSGDLLLQENCNMKCSYCFEIDKKNLKMSNKTAIDGFEFLYNNEVINRKNGMFPKDVRITLFGGEPMLNFDAIVSVLDAIKKKPKDEIKIKVELTTNGTILNQEMADYFKDFIKEYELYVQISIDGKREVHDLSRVFPDGSGSFSSIEKNIELFKYIFEGKENNKLLSIRGSLNKKTIPFMYESWKFFRQEWGIKATYFRPVSGEDWDLSYVKIYEDQLMYIAKDMILETILKKDIKVMEFNYPLCDIFLKNKSRKFCGAGRTACCITSNGDIYPCFEFYYSFNDQFKIGNIYTNIEDNKRILFTNIDSEDTNCIKKGCKNYNCYRCLAQNFEATGTIINCEFNLLCDFSTVEEKIIRNTKKILIDKGFKI